MDFILALCFRETRTRFRVAIHSNTLITDHFTPTANLFSSIRQSRWSCAVTRAIQGMSPMDFSDRTTLIDNIASGRRQAGRRRGNGTMKSKLTEGRSQCSHVCKTLDDNPPIP